MNKNWVSPSDVLFLLVPLTSNNGSLRAHEPNPNLIILVTLKKSINNNKKLLPHPTLLPHFNMIG
jgi:hypothetical protein